jgi:hypothetical protein
MAFAFAIGLVVVLGDLVSPVRGIIKRKETMPAKVRAGRRKMMCTIFVDRPRQFFLVTHYQRLG